MGYDLTAVGKGAEGKMMFNSDHHWTASGWSHFLDWLARWGVNTEELNVANEGKVVSAATCGIIAGTIREFKHSFDNDLLGGDLSHGGAGKEAKFWEQYEKAGGAVIG
jgi:hypothetical protein